MTTDETETGLARVRRRPQSSVVRARGVARGARDEARASFARVSACEGAEKVFRERIVASRARRRDVGVARRGVEKGWCEGQSHLARGAGESCAREREISEEVFATCER